MHLKFWHFSSSQSARKRARRVAFAYLHYTYIRASTCASHTRTCTWVKHPYLCRPFLIYAENSELCVAAGDSFLPAPGATSAPPQPMVGWMDEVVLLVVIIIIIIITIIIVILIITTIISFCY
jgi:hypothetical protein